MKRCVKIITTSGNTYEVFYDEAVVEDGFEYFYNKLNNDPIIFQEKFCFLKINTKYVESAMRLLKEISGDENDPNNWVVLVQPYIVYNL